MERVIDFLQRRLKQAGARRLAAISASTGVPEQTLIKLMYAQRDNPRLSTAQPLLDYFHAIDRGEIELPLPDIDPRYLPQQHEEGAHG